MAEFQKILKIFTWMFFIFSGGSADAGVVNTPQKLPVNKFVVCGKTLQLEMATQESERSIGLMYRNKVEPGAGMLFVFPFAAPRQFWMKNVGFDIDIGYFDSRGKLLNSLTMAGSSPLVQDDALPRYESRGPAQFAVEVEKGFFGHIKNLSQCTLRPLPKVTF